MIENTTLIKIGGSLIAFATTGFVYKKIFVETKNLQTYLVQANSDGNKEELEKYVCELNKEIDDKCQILKLNFNEWHHISTKEIMESKEKFTKKILKDSFYKLTINKNKIKESFTNRKTEISIKTIDKTPSEIAKLTIVSSLNEEDINNPKEKWEDSKILVKANKSFDLTTPITKCIVDFKQQKTDIKCSIYEFNDVPKNKNNLDFSKIKKITKLNQIQSGKYYLVDFSIEDVKNKKEKLKTFKNISYINEKSTNNETIKENNRKPLFSFVAKIIAHIETEESNYSKNQALILKNDAIKNKNNETYIIAKSKSEKNVSGLSDNPKNYKCVVNNNKTDNNCQLIEIKDTEKTLLEITDAEKTLNFNSANDNSVKYFKIVADNKIIDSIQNWNGKEEIKIVSLDDSKSTEYKKLEALFLIENGVVTKGQTNLFIVETFFKEENSESKNVKKWDQYKCQIQDSTTEKNCDVYKFIKKPDTNDLSTFLSSKIEKISAKQEWDDESFYVVSLKNQEKIDVSTLQDDDEIFFKNSENNQIVATAAISFPLSNLNDTFNKNQLLNSKLLISEYFVE